MSFIVVNTMGRRNGGKIEPKVLRYAFRYYFAVQGLYRVSWLLETSIHHPLFPYPYGVPDLQPDECARHLRGSSAPLAEGIKCCSLDSCSEYCRVKRMTDLPLPVREHDVSIGFASSFALHCGEEKRRPCLLLFMLRVNPNGGWRGGGIRKRNRH